MDTHIPPPPPAGAVYDNEAKRYVSRNCAHCANWMQLKTAPHAGFCRLASAERTTHSGSTERFGLMTTDLQVCSQWMDAHPK